MGDETNPGVELSAHIEKLAKLAANESTDADSAVKFASAAKALAEADAISMQTQHHRKHVR